MQALLIPGYWNSGTTLLVDLLRKHPDLQLTRGRWLPNLEERNTKKMLARYGERFVDLGPGYQLILSEGWPAHKEPRLTPSEIRQFRRRFGLIFKTWPGKVLLAKNPWWMFAPDFFRQVFANDEVRYLMIFRAGIHQVVSKDYWLRGPFPPEEQLRRRAEFWKMCVDYYFEHWHGREEVLTLTYEALCDDPRAAIRRVCAHLGLDPEPLLPKVPEQIANRTRHWDHLEPRLQEMVQGIVAPAQARLDEALSL